MALVDLRLPADEVALPREVLAFLGEADRRIERFQRDCHVPGFVPSDFARSYRLLRGLDAAGATQGKLFCEWGSGFGVTACLAAMLEFDAFGIEIEGELVDSARQLARDFDLPVEFIHGSFIPADGAACFAKGEEFSWLTVEHDGGQEGQSLGPADFDVVFAYPWPDEERLIAALFERCASAGSVLVTYHEREDLRVRRKKA